MTTSPSVVFRIVVAILLPFAIELAGCGSGSSSLPSDAAADPKPSDVPMDVSQEPPPADLPPADPPPADMAPGDMPPREGGTPLPPSPGKIPCAMAMGMIMSCDVSTQECCIQNPTPCDGGGDAGGSDAGADAKPDAACGMGSGGSKCVAKGTCKGDVTLACDGPDDCAAGQVCCFKPAAPMTTDEGATTCETTCPMGTAVVCHEDKDCPMDRPNCCGKRLGICRAKAC